MIFVHAEQGFPVAGVGGWPALLSKRKNLVELCGEGGGGGAPQNRQC